MKGRFSNGMDPQKLSQLDPKLREAYQRVMGTTIPTPQPPSQTQTAPVSDPATIPSPIPSPIPEPMQPGPTSPNLEPSAPPQAPADQQEEPFFIPQPETPTSGVPQPQAPTPMSSVPEPATTPTQQTSANFVQMNSEVPASPQTQATNFSNFAAPPVAPQTQAIVIKKKNSLMPIVFGFVGVIFLVIYTLFWTKIFNFRLPFLP